MSRLHAHRVELVIEELSPGAEGRRWALLSPAPGWFRPAVEAAAWCGPGAVIGTLDVLGRVHLLVVPPGIAGSVAEIASGGQIGSLAPRAVAYRDPIVQLASRPATADAGIEAAPVGDAAQSADGLVFRAPTSGRFYGRSSPDKPPFVTPGMQLAHGATICLLEVMKTFHRVTYSGVGLPDNARVVRVIVADGDDVNAGDPLLALE